jgi:transposase
VAQEAPEKLVYVDETGIDNHEALAYGWSPRGEPCWGEKPGHRTQRVSIIDALNQNTLIAPFVFEGYCTTALFEAYVEHCLVPVLQPGQIVLYDNASFHQSAKARQLIEGAGCSCKFLPPYSPDLNPIEHCWFPFKQRIRKQLPLHNRDLHKAIDAVFKQMAEP